MKNVGTVAVPNNRDKEVIFKDWALFNDCKNTNK